MRIIDDFGEGMTEAQKKSMMMHTIIAILCFPLYDKIPALFGLVISPYVMWMIFCPRQELLLPLAIHFLTGSQQRYMALFACFLYCIFHLDMLIKRRVLWVFVLYLTSLPFFIWYTMMRYKVFGGGIGAGGTFEGLGYYLGLSFFFWAVASGKRICRNVPIGLMVLSAFFVISFFCGALNLFFSRFVFWAYPFMPAVAFWLILKKGGVRRNKKWFFVTSLCGMLLLLGLLSIGGYSVTFTIFGTTVFACVLLFCARKLIWILRFLCPLVILPILTWRMFYTIDYWDRNVKGHGDSISYSEIKVRDWESLKYKLYRKTMTDRAPVWAASLEAVKKQIERDPIFVDVNAVYGEFTLTNDFGVSREMHIDIAAHNMLLEMLRLYGLWGGFGIYIIFLLLGSLPFMIKSHVILRDTFWAPVLACCISHIIVGGQTGQYPVSPQFTYYLFGLMGVCYAQAWIIKHDVEKRNAYPVAYQYYPA